MGYIYGVSLLYRMDNTYKIIGADGREYGPASLDELKAWVQQGRVAGFTQVWRSDLGIWAPASQCDEIKASVPNLPPPLSPADPSLVSVGFWVRLGAYLVDAILLNLVLSLMFAPFNSKLQGLATGAPPSLEELPKILLLILGLTTVASMLSCFYYVGMNWRFGATLGKMVIGAKIVNLDGSPIDFTRALWRYSGEILSWFTLGIGYLMIGLRDDKRGLHDLLAKTRVIYRR